MSLKTRWSTTRSAFCAAFVSPRSLDFNIEPLTAEMVRRHAALIEGVSAERQRDELVQILRTSRAARAFA